MGGRANDVYDRSHFGVRTAYGIDGRELADTEGSDDGPNPSDSRIAVCGVAGVELIAVSHPVQAGRGNVVECGEVVVSRYAMDAAEAELVEPAEQVVC